MYDSSPTSNSGPPLSTSKRSQIAWSIVFTFLCACGSDDGGNAGVGSPDLPGDNTGEPPDDNAGAPAPPLICESPGLEWIDRSPSGGDVAQVLFSGGLLFATLDGRIWMLDASEGKWIQTSARGTRIARTPSGLILTDSGYALDPGRTEWKRLEFAQSGDWFDFALRDDGAAVYRAAWGDKSLYVSYDDAQTWSRLAEAPGLVMAIDSSSDGVYALVMDDDDGSHRSVWRLDAASGEWTGPLLTGRFHWELAAAAGGGVVVGAIEQAFWSTDGVEWRLLEYDGSSYVGEFAGKDAEGSMLLARGEEVLRVNEDGTLEALMSVTGGIKVHDVHFLNEETALVATINGVWRAQAGGDGQLEYQQIGIPGGFARRTFHFRDGIFASINPAAGVAYLAKLDETAGQWEQQVLTSSVVVDMAQTRSGRFLLATHNAEEGGYGDLLTWDGLGALKWVLRAAPPVDSVAIDDAGNAFLAFGEGREGNEHYEVWISKDEGDSWEETALAATGPRRLANSCGIAHATGPDGLHAYDSNASEWRKIMEIASPTKGISAVDGYAIVFSDNRIWTRKGCDAEWIMVSVPEGTEYINSVIVDRKGGLWAATNQGGFHLGHEGEPWRSFDSGSLNGTIDHFSLGQDGTIWVHVSECGLWSSRPGTET